AQAILAPLLSSHAVITPLSANNQLIVTDLNGNIRKIQQLLQSIDAPNSGLVIGQYAVKSSPISDLIENAQRILKSISNEQPVTLVPHTPSGSIFIIASPFIVERAIPILARLDQNFATTNIYKLNDLKFTRSGEIPS